MICMLGDFLNVQIICVHDYIVHEYFGSSDELVFLQTWPRSSHLENLAKILKTLEDSSKISKKL